MRQRIKNRYERFEHGKEEGVGKVLIAAAWLLKGMLSQHCTQDITTALKSLQKLLKSL
ncbi:hypothetical protein St703_23270 [Sporolactobacillus terrae]|uniref:Uncharacterized protein n=1 Tax=Sporolactobacillus terrae TaxID=269673 RepID=A0A5K7WZ97_9BACL|nr:hypothetical protein St703_23270 [Sporolactobacillus terrae]